MGSRDRRWRNPCLTMHQPWASLLVHGIKRIEGRAWPAPLRGRLWIHAASKVPDDATIKAMEEFYREIYAVDGITDLKFPERYPVSRLLGCVEVVGCLRREELTSWKEVPEGVRLEGLTNFCWLCEQPRKLSVPIEMRGNQGVYDLERKFLEAAVRGLVQVESLLPVKFPLPDPRDPFSLKPGSVSLRFPESEASEVGKSSKLSAAIAGATAAATQFSKKDHNFETNSFRSRNVQTFNRPFQLKNNSHFEHKTTAIEVANQVSHLSESSSGHRKHPPVKLSDHAGRPHLNLSNHAGPPKIFAAAVRGLKEANSDDPERNMKSR